MFPSNEVDTVDEDVISINSTSEAVNATNSSPPGPPPRRVYCLTLSAVLHEGQEEGKESQAEESQVEEGNAPETEATESKPEDVPSKPARKKRFPVVAGAPAEVVNGTHFLELLADQSDPAVTNRSTPGQCTLGFFYAEWCPYSAAAAPHFNALSRLFPDVRLLAVDTGSAAYVSGINTQYGVMALPTVILFHNARQVGERNVLFSVT